MTTTANRERNFAADNEVNGLTDPGAYHKVERKTVTLRHLAAEGGRITRFRMLSEIIPGMGRCFDVSYIHGELGDGTPVRVTAGLPNLMRKWEIKGLIIEWAKSEGVYAKSVPGLLDSGSRSVLY